MNVPNFNVFRFDGPIDHHLLRPFGLQRLPPAPPGPPPRPQVDVDAYLHQHAPAFDKFISWQRQSVQVTETDIKQSRRAKDGAQLRQWICFASLVPAVGLLATSYSMMFTFPFVVPGMLLFLTAGAAVVVLLGFLGTARVAYNEALADWERALCMLESRREALATAETTYARLQAQFSNVISPAAPRACDMPNLIDLQAPAQAQAPVPPRPARTRRVRKMPRAQHSPAPSSSSLSVAQAQSFQPAEALSAQTATAFGESLLEPFKLPPSMFGYNYFTAASSQCSVSRESVASAAGAKPVPQGSGTQTPGSVHSAFDGWTQD